MRHLQPDVILVAVGAQRAAAPIPGADRTNVLDGDDLRHLMTGSDASVAVEKLSLRQRAMLKMGTIWASRAPRLTRELTRHAMPLGRRVAVVGGGLVGIELAEFLSARSHAVTRARRVVGAGHRNGAAAALARA